MTNKEYADLLLPNISETICELESRYPKRELKEGTIVTRFAPSPTGFVHIGSLFSAIVAKKMCKQTDGVYFLRIEDTDQKRTVDNGITNIIDDLEKFNVTFDEGAINESDEVGNYGPYMQSRRSNIYKTFIKHLIEEDLAYPCFCTAENLETDRLIQEKNKDRIGYYGKWARCHDLAKEEVIKRINNNEPYIIRLKSPGNFDNKIKFTDLVKGEVEFPENDLDIVILKADGLPTYHFAHLVDDYLMRTTHVIRGDEWLSSLPIHVQLFKVFGFKTPKYAHLAPLMKEENGNKRKISKRKDDEAAVSYYHEKGIPFEAVKLYIMTVANSNFEGWLEQNPTVDIDNFKMEFKKVSSSGSLFDMEKLLNISKNYISKLKAIDVYERALEYLNIYDKDLYNLLEKYKEYSIGLFNIEREQKKPRKDLAMFSDIRQEIWYMYDELYKPTIKDYEYQVINEKNEIELITDTYISNYYNDNDDKETWFNKIKLLAEELGYAKEVKEFKENPDNYKGHVGDVSTVLRVALTTKNTTPDLYELMKLLGKDRIKIRYSELEELV